MWHHEQWFGSIFPATTKKDQSLAAYAQHFNSVEGNTSFYHIPDEKTVHRWDALVPNDFRFTFKFHRSISHDKKQLSTQSELRIFLKRMALLEEKLGCLMLQLPASFSPSHFSHLVDFIRLLPKDFCYAIEVRHLGFFDKSEQEKRLNQLLAENHINRVIMDTRALFSCSSNGNKFVEEAHRKKPKVPTNVIATATTPIVRFVGHPNIQANKPFYTPWIHKTKQWLDEGKTPYLFFHMANAYEAPWLAEAFFNDYQQLYPDSRMPKMDLPKTQSSQLDIFSSDLSV